MSDQQNHVPQKPARTRKIVLNKETIRQINDDEADRVGGGSLALLLSYNSMCTGCSSEGAYGGNNYSYIC